MVPDMTPAEQELTARIGLRLREARRAQKLSLSELSARTGGALSKSRISNYEQGLRRLEIEEAQALAAALWTVSAGYLLCLEEEQELLRCFRAADERGQRTSLAMAKAQGSAAEGRS
jgi:transcriptional regulator with XRE-family HTH domain